MSSCARRARYIGGQMFMSTIRKFAQLFVVILVCHVAVAAQSKWSEQKANDWYKRQPWLVGSNYVPAYAINELEMWQADTFDPQKIDRELGWAEGLGMK